MIRLFSMDAKKPNKHAANMARLRWDKTTKEQRSAHAKMMVTAREARKPANQGQPESTLTSVANTDGSTEP
jgi:hypothetical protein